MTFENSTRSKWFIPSLVLLTGIVVAAVVIVIMTLVSGDDDTPQRSPISDTQSADVEPSACDLEPDVNMSMDEPPEVEDSVTVGLVAVPASDEFGPVEMSENVPVCWQYSEAGAVAAAYTFSAVATDTGSLTLDHLKAHLVDGPGREILIDELENADSPGNESVSIKPVGYRVLDFGDGQADIDVLVENTEHRGAYGAAKTPLVWENGDWKLDVQDNGEYYTDVRDVADSSNFTLWEAESP